MQFALLVDCSSQLNITSHLYHFLGRSVGSLSSSISFSLLHLLECSHRAVQGVLVVSSELGVGAFERGVAIGLGLFDAVGGLLAAALSHSSDYSCRRRFS